MFIYSVVKTHETHIRDLGTQNGVDVRTLSEMLGHYSARFTLSTYVHSTPSMRVQAADTIGQMIGREVV